MKTTLALITFLTTFALLSGTATAAVGDYYNVVTQIDEINSDNSATGYSKGWTEGFDKYEGVTFTTEEALLATQANYVPSVDVGQGKTWTMTAHYDLNDGVAFNFVNFKTTVVTNNSDGGLFTDHDTPRSVTITITIYDTESDEELGYGEKTITFASETAYLQGVGCAFEDSDGTLTMKSDYIDKDFYITITASNPDGNEESETVYYGIQSVNLSLTQTDVILSPEEDLDTPVATIPEPTTATLSLLALAGLTARRRRR